jgi:GTP-binding protein EngB required for normal cell division
MNKYNVGFSIKLPIPDQQYSNLEARFSWEEETDLPFEQAMEQAEKQIEVLRDKVDKVGAQMQAHYKSLIEQQEAKLSKAREEYIKLKSTK